MSNIQQVISALLTPTNGQTNQLPIGYKSPIPDQDVVAHSRGVNPVQTLLQQGWNGAQAMGKQMYGMATSDADYHFSKPQVLGASVTPMQPSPTMQQPTPTALPGNSFAGFTTSKIPSDLAPIILQSAQKAGVDPNVFASLLFSEHGFQTTEGRNSNGDGSYDRGIAQINNKAHPDVTDEQAMDPNFAIPWAANLLGSHIKNMNGDYNRGIAAYNVGAGGASIQGSSTAGLGPRGQAYLDKVAHGLTPELRKKLGIKTTE